MRIQACRGALLLSMFATVWGCGTPSSQPPTSGSPAPAAATTPAPDDAEPGDDLIPAPAVRSAAVLAALLPSNATGCAPGARCIRVTANGSPSNSATSVVQCRGEMPDFIVPRSTIPANYTGPWFQPNL